MNFKKLFINYCKNKDLEKNESQVRIIELIDNFYQQNFKSSFLSTLFSKKKEKPGFYLQGDVGVGKTMILNFFYENFNHSKQRLHFNEFMIGFHDFVFQNKDNKKNNIVDKFVNNLKKKYKLIYFDEFQVTNIVDAMILGNLFKKIFDENIKVIFSSNIKINDLYKDGLQREQFLPFISIIKKYSIEKELLLDDDYRLQDNENFERIFFPLNEKTSFKISQKFRELTRNKKKVKKIIATKGRNFKIDNFFEGVAKFKFAELCDVNIGAEDYINIAYVCDHIFIEDIPNFNEDNSNQQLRFITLIDILYEKEISLTLSLPVELIKLSSSKKHLEIFKRTLSRLFEMTKIK